MTDKEITRLFKEMLARNGYTGKTRYIDTNDIIVIEDIARNAFFFYFNEDGSLEEID